VSSCGTGSSRAPVSASTPVAMYVLTRIHTNRVLHVMQHPTSIIAPPPPTPPPLHKDTHTPCVPKRHGSWHYVLQRHPECVCCSRQTAARSGHASCLLTHATAMQQACSRHAEQEAHGRTTSCLTCHTSRTLHTHLLYCSLVTHVSHLSHAYVTCHTHIPRVTHTSHLSHTSLASHTHRTHKPHFSHTSLTSRTHISHSTHTSH